MLAAASYLAEVEAVNRGAAWQVWKDLLLERPQHVTYYCAFMFQAFSFLLYTYHD